MAEKVTLKKRTGLGKGLSALLEDSDTVNAREEVYTPVSAEVSPGSIVEIPLDAIEVNPFQPRTHFDRAALEELAESIKVQGIIQPITVRRLEEGSYQLISGERRLQASKLAGLKGIPAYVRTANDQQMLEMALIENIQREDLNAIEVALSYQRMISECNLKQEELGDRVGKNRSTVNNYLRLLKLPPDIQAGLRDKKITMGHARALINVEDVVQQLSLYRKASEEEWSVRKIEEAVRNLMKQEEPETSKKKPQTRPNYELAQWQSRLSTRYGTKVQIRKTSDDKGEIKIPFFSDEDFNRILDMLEGGE